MSDDLIRFRLGENVLLTGRVVWRRPNGLVGLQITNGALITVDEAALTAATEGIPQPDVLPDVLPPLVLPPLVTRDLAGPRDVRRSPGRPRKQIPN